MLRGTRLRQYFLRELVFLLFDPRADFEAYKGADGRAVFLE
jgi:hypothetical protein